MQHTETIAIERPLAAVWELVGDPSNWARWMSGVTDVKLEGELKPGTELSFTWRGKQRKATITQYVRNQEVAISGEEPGYSFTESIWLRGMGTMTNVSMSSGFESKTLWGTALTPLLIAIKKIGMGRPMRKSLNALRTAAEGVKEPVAA